MVEAAFPKSAQYEVLAGIPESVLDAGFRAHGEAERRFIPLFRQTPIGVNLTVCSWNRFTSGERLHVIPAIFWPESSHTKTLWWRGPLVKFHSSTNVGKIMRSATKSIVYQSSGSFPVCVQTASEEPAGPLDSGFRGNYFRNRCAQLTCRRKPESSGVAPSSDGV